MIDNDLSEAKADSDAIVDHLLTSISYFSGKQLEHARKEDDAWAEHHKNMVSVSDFLNKQEKGGARDKVSNENNTPTN